MNFDQLLYHCQPDAGPFLRSAFDILNPVKSFENFVHFCFGNSNPSVFNSNFNVIAIACDRYLNEAFFGVLECVRKKIKNNLFPHVNVQVYWLCNFFCFENQFHSGLFNGGPEIADQIFGNRDQIHRCKISLHSSGFDPGKIQQ